MRGRVRVIALGRGLALLFETLCNRAREASQAERCIDLGLARTKSLKYTWFRILNPKPKLKPRPPGKFLGIFNEDAGSNYCGIINHLVEAGPSREHRKKIVSSHLDEEKSARIALRGTSHLLFARCIAVVDLKKLGLCCKGDVVFKGGSKKTQRYTRYQVFSKASGSVSHDGAPLLAGRVGEGAPVRHPHVKPAQIYRHTGNTSCRKKNN